MAIDRHNWRQKYLDAQTLPDSATSQQKAQRGRDFEAILRAMFEEAGLDPRVGYRPTGEEVDGSIWLDGRTVLIEAKWTAAKHPASSIYQFKGKVDGKLVGTIGLFISINGFSKDAINALVAGKDVNIILAEGADIRAIAENRISVLDVLHGKLRAAGEEGTVYWPVEEALQSARVATPRTETRRIVVVEARMDVEYLEAVRAAFGIDVPVSIVPAGGPQNMPRLIRSLTQGSDKVIVTAIVDGDIDEAFRSKMLADVSPALAGTGSTFEIIAAEPDLETALGLNPYGVSWNERDHLRRPSTDMLTQIITMESVLEHARDNPSTQQILRVIAGPDGPHPMADR
ncbi:restriction endonuclease [Microbacterium sp. AGC85]